MLTRENFRKSSTLLNRALSLWLTNWENLSGTSNALTPLTLLLAVFNKEPSTSLPTPPARMLSSMPALTISHDGISPLLENIKISSSTGVDEINSKLLKNTSHTITAYLCIFSSHSLPVGLMANERKVGRVVPVYKSGKKDSPLNYRPISLTSDPCKNIEHVICSHIMAFLDKNNFFHRSQHGFRGGSYARHNWPFSFVTCTSTSTPTCKLTPFS